MEGKELNDLMRIFEANAKKYIRLGAQGLKREERDQWKSGKIYCDGATNEAFRMYQIGYSLGKAMHQN